MEPGWAAVETSEAGIDIPNREVNAKFKTDFDDTIQKVTVVPQGDTNIFR